MTICAYKRKCLFGEVVATSAHQEEINITSVGAIHESPEVQEMSVRLSRYGKIVDEIIKILSVRFAEAKIEKHVIMPNHIHLIVFLSGETLRAIRESPLQKRSELSKIIGFLKMNVSKKIHILSPSPEIWQRGYHDHIIRNEKSYQKIWNYIEHNPATWEQDCFFEGGHT